MANFTCTLIYDDSGNATPQFAPALDRFAVGDIITFESPTDNTTIVFSASPFEDPPVLTTYFIQQGTTLPLTCRSGLHFLCLRNGGPVPGGGSVPVAGGGN